METIRESIEVDVPVSTIYNQWTQFEEFPQFMEGVESVKQTDDTHLYWVAEVGGKRREWQAEIVEQKPDRKSPGGRSTATGRTASSSSSRLARTRRSSRSRSPTNRRLHRAARGEGRHRLAPGQRDLERFKELIESRGVETGAWRGEVHAGEPQR